MRDNKEVREMMGEANALRGVVKSLQRVIGMPGVEDPLW